MAQIQSIQALAESHAQEVSRSPRDWKGYLDTAAQQATTYIGRLR